MSNTIPAVQKYMTPTPHTIGVDQTLERAGALMDQYGVRHLPVLRGGKLVGMISERDIAVASSFPGIDPSTEHVEDAMTAEVYVVAPDAALDTVAEKMAKHKYGSAVVMQGTSVVGVVTTVDVCRALTDVLRERCI